jgi:hypothetical protein
MKDHWDTIKRLNLQSLNIEDREEVKTENIEYIFK